MRSLGRTVLLGLGVASVACSSVRVVQRDGCWVKRTEGMFGSNEEMGFCTRKQEQVATDDRLTRLMQECIAQADHRWENQALAAWNRNQQVPPQADDATVVKMCMTQVSTALGLEQENAALKARLADMGQDREALRAANDRDREYMQQNSGKMVDALGEAAKKPAPNATATATVKSETDVKGTQTPGSTVVGFAPQPQMAPVIINPTPPPVMQAPVLQAPPLEVKPPPQDTAQRPAAATCPGGKVPVKKLTPEGHTRNSCELPAKPFAG